MSHYTAVMKKLGTAEWQGELWNVCRETSTRIEMWREIPEGIVITGGDKETYGNIEVNREGIEHSEGYSEPHKSEENRAEGEEQTEKSSLE